MSIKMLTTKGVAQLLNVSEATVKRWADDGLIKAEKTIGGHRRFHIEKIARFQQEQGLGVRAFEVQPIKALSQKQLGKQEFDTKYNLLFSALVNGNSVETSALLLNVYMKGFDLSYIFDRLICKAMRRVGDLWYRGELTIAQEHLATRTAMTAINALRAASTNGAQTLPFRAICCTIEDDFHELPLHLTQALLESDGWEVINLGASMPFYSLAEAALRHNPVLVCVSSTVFYGVDRAAREYKDFQAMATKKGISVVLGGNGFSDKKIQTRFPANLHATSFTQLSNFTKTLLTGSVKNQI